MKHFLLISFSLLFIFSCTEDGDGPIGGGDPDEPIEDGVIQLTFEDSGSDDLSLEDHNDGVDYYINQELTFSGDLVIEPGVIIEFGELGSLTIAPGGSINAVGTATKKIVFTGEVKVKGSWKGIIISSPSIKNRFEYCTIEYGGKSKWENNIQGGLTTWAGGTFALKNCMLSNNKDYAVETYYSDVAITEFEGNMFMDNDRPISIAPSAIHMLGPDNVYDDEENVIMIQEVFQLFDNDVENETYTWKPQGIPYRLAQNLRVSSNTLRLDPGVEMEFTELGYLEINGGYLHAEGTAESPVIFTGVNKTIGSWPGIYYAFSYGVVNTLDHCIIEYAGSNLPAFTKGIIKMVDAPNLSVTNCTFENISRCIFDETIHASNVNLSLSGNTFDNTGDVVCS